jgi:gentisate 1,2-dioxygenase
VYTLVRATWHTHTAAAEETSVLLDGTEAATMVKQAGEAATEERKNHISGQPGVENDKAETSETNVTTLRGPAR